jgi:nicotinate-nucleotide--dimethylbenzimidazole phosphoribosyltransferase
MNDGITGKMQKHLDNLTKPKGSLGRLEEMALRLAEIQNAVPPKIGKKAVYVFAGDHGVVEEGVSLYPKDVTRQMVLNFLSGGAAINALARGCGFDVFAVDAGVAGTFPPDCGVLDLKVGQGTRNMLKEPAMTEAELQLALARGGNLAASAADAGYDLVAVGDMGIGNTTTAAVLLLASGMAVDDVVDRGTGIDDAALARKREVVAASAAKHAPYPGPEAILRAVGGYDFAMMAGFILGLKGRRVACVLDGFPVTAAAYMAWRMDPAVRDYLFSGHLSKVRGHRPVLRAMGLEPILDLGMRLGEGTGAVLGANIIDLAVKTSREMASFDSAEVSRSTDDEKSY